MKKYSSEVDELISKLIGSGSNISEPFPLEESILEEPKITGKYQLPLRHTKGGVKIDKNNQPWIVGTFSRKPFKRPADPPGAAPRPHWGVDLAAPKGVPVYPVGPGVITKVAMQPTPVGGKTIYMSHEDGKVISYYAHLSKINVSVGDVVGLETVIAEVGDTGNAIGFPHLHYEVKINGTHIDPKSIIGKDVGSLTKQAQMIQVSKASSKKLFEVANRFKISLAKLNY